MGADKKANTQGRFEPRAAYLSTRSVELPLSPSVRAAPPLGPSWFQARLPAREKAVSMGADTLELVRVPTSAIATWCCS